MCCVQDQLHMVVVISPDSSINTWTILEFSLKQLHWSKGILTHFCFLSLLCSRMELSSEALWMQQHVVVISFFFFFCNITASGSRTAPPAPQRPSSTAAAAAWWSFVGAPELCLLLLLLSQFNLHSLAHFSHCHKHSTEWYCGFSGLHRSLLGTVGSHQLHIGRYLKINFCLRTTWVDFFRFSCPSTYVSLLEVMRFN